MVLAIIICCITLSAAYSNNENTSDSSEKELRIAVAWRADTDNEFYYPAHMALIGLLARWLQ